MRYLSVCSGIEAASVAWHPLGWEAVAFSEIEKFPCAVLAHHYPSVPNWGDMTKYQEWPDADIDVLVGGTPCQSFSVAGLRKGLDDPHGNLMLTFGAIAKRYRPRWLVWENVPGVLSSDGGKDFGTFLGMLAELGYGFAYRVLDAQYVRVESHARAVPQRRRRVFVVGCLGGWRRAAAVLFERESLQGHPAPRREAGKRVAPTVASGPPFSRTGNERVEHEVLVADVASTLNAHYGDKQGLEDQHINQGAPLFVSHALTRRYDGSEDGCGRGAPIVPIAVARTLAVNETTGSLCAESGPNTHGSRGVSGTQTQLAGYIQPVAFTSKGNGEVYESEITNSLQSAGGGQAGQGFIAARVGMAVRRLTPRECERLQGFPDDYTLIEYRGKPAADGPRYKALGNSMAVNVMFWIAQRIQLASEIKDTEAVA